MRAIAGEWPKQTTWLRSAGSADGFGFSVRRRLLQDMTTYAQLTGYNMTSGVKGISAACALDSAWRLCAVISGLSEVKSRRSTAQFGYDLAGGIGRADAQC